MSRPLRLLVLLDRLFGLLLRAVPLTCFVAIAAVLCANLLGRMTGLFSMSWLDEVLIALFAWMIFFGAAALWREREHFAIDLLPALLAGGWGERPLRILVALLGLGFALALLYYGYEFVGRVRSTTPILALPQAWSYACMPLSGAVMAIYALRDLLVALTAAPKKGD